MEYEQFKYESNLYILSRAKEIARKYGAVYVSVREREHELEAGFYGYCMDEKLKIDCLCFKVDNFFVFVVPPGAENSNRWVAVPPRFNVTELAEKWTREGVRAWCYDCLLAKGAANAGNNAICLELDHAYVSFSLYTEKMDDFTRKATLRRRSSRRSFRSIQFAVIDNSDSLDTFKEFLFTVSPSKNLGEQKISFPEGLDDLNGAIYEGMKRAEEAFYQQLFTYLVVFGEKRAVVLAPSIDGTKSIFPEAGCDDLESYRLGEFNNEGWWSLPPTVTMSEGNYAVIADFFFTVCEGMKRPEKGFHQQLFVYLVIFEGKRVVVLAPSMNDAESIFPEASYDDLESYCLGEFSGDWQSFPTAITMGN
jgi:hypothetical protein